MSSTKGLQARIRAAKAELATVTQESKRLAKQKKAAQALNEQRFQELTQLNERHSRVLLELNNTNDEIEELEEELTALKQERHDKSLESVERVCGDLIKRSLESVERRDVEERKAQDALAALEDTGDSSHAFALMGDLQVREMAVQYGKFTCVISVPRDASFGDMVEEACSYWGIPSAGAFLQGMDGCLYPNSTLVLPAVGLAVSLHRAATAVADAKATTEDVWPNRPDTLFDAYGRPAFRLRRPKRTHGGRRGGGDGDGEVGASSFDPRREEAAAQVMSERKSKLVREAIFLVVFLVLFGTELALRRNVQAAYWMTSTVRSAMMERTFVSEPDARTYLPLFGPTQSFERMQFADVNTPLGFWKWAEGPLTHTIFPDPTTNKSGPILTYNRLVGSVRFRQLRVRPNIDCEVADRARNLVLECFADYSEGARATGPFGDAPSPGFTWTSAEAALADGGTPQLRGQLATYDASGYIRDFAGNRQAWLAGLAALRAGGWVDRATRAVVVSFNLFNDNLDLYLSVQVLLEQHLAGALLPSVQFATMNLSACVACTARALLELVLHALVLYLLFTIVVNVRAVVLTTGSVLPYVKSAWNLLDLAVLGMYLAAFAIRVRLLLSSSAFESTLWDRGTYSDITARAADYQATFALDALIIFACMLRVFKYMTLSQRLLQFILVFLRAASEIVLFGILFVGVFVGFIILGHEIYGPEMEDFSDLMRSTRTLLKMMVGDFDYDAMRQVDPTWTPIFFVLYLGFVVFVMVNVFLAILNESYTAVREELTAEAIRLRKIRSMKTSRGTPWSRCLRFMRKTLSMRRMLVVESAASVRGNAAAAEESERSRPATAEIQLGTMNPYL